MLEATEIQALLTALRDQGMTVREIAEALEVGLNTVFRWQAGIHVPSNARSVEIALRALLAQDAVPPRFRDREE